MTNSPCARHKPPLIALCVVRCVPLVRDIQSVTAARQIQNPPPQINRAGSKSQRPQTLPILAEAQTGPKRQQRALVVRKLIGNH